MVELAALSVWLVLCLGEQQALVQAPVVTSRPEKGPVELLRMQVDLVLLRMHDDLDHSSQLLDLVEARALGTARPGVWGC